MPPPPPPPAPRWWAPPTAGARWPWRSAGTQSAPGAVAPVTDLEAQDGTVVGPIVDDAPSLMNPVQNVMVMVDPALDGDGERIASEIRDAEVGEGSSYHSARSGFTPSSIGGPRDDACFARCVAQCNMKYFRRVLLEFVGTFIFYFFSIGGVIVSRLPHYHASDLLRAFIASVFVFLGGVAQTCITSHLGLTHVTPLATAVDYVMAKGIFIHVPLILFAQLCGVLSVCTSYYIIYPDSIKLYALTMPSVSTWRAIFAEAGATAVQIAARCFLYYNKKAPTGRLRGVIMSFVSALVSFLTGPATGASMNPFRSISSSIVSGVFHHWYVYWIGPPCGATVGAAIVRGFGKFEAPDDPEESPRSAGRVQQGSPHMAQQGRQALPAAPQAPRAGQEARGRLPQDGAPRQRSPHFPV